VGDAGVGGRAPLDRLTERRESGKDGQQRAYIIWIREVFQGLDKFSVIAVICHCGLSALSILLLGLSRLLPTKAGYPESPGIPLACRWQDRQESATTRYCSRSPGSPTGPQRLMGRYLATTDDFKNFQEAVVYWQKDLASWRASVDDAFIFTGGAL
jgi:hypothetical protein